MQFFLAKKSVKEGGHTNVIETNDKAYYVTVGGFCEAKSVAFSFDGRAKQVGRGRFKEIFFSWPAFSRKETY